ncbi:MULTISPECIES: 2-phospho-L-lactate guanylyltransferase [Subtercola]|uniref:2-phospho-L-lactate guanylyltransferase n=1 Tax=Subtercola TaxID=120212 RepID=UPI00137633B7|nr:MULTISPECIES: 2-phospho-L-lactate guanylyltransferase [Subtercola]MEA9985535.1 hypothetical protein [Subtercola sp. RTI3]
MTAFAALRWVVVVPVKGSNESKSRLASFPLSVAERRDLALAFALDTVDAILRAPDVLAVVIVTNDPASAAALAGLDAAPVRGGGKGSGRDAESGSAKALGRGAVIDAIPLPLRAGARDAGGAFGRGAEESPLRVEVIPDAGSGLNAAIADGLRFARGSWPAAGVAVMTADLPTLDTADVVDALGRAAGHPRSFVADADGTGTTTIAARPGEPLRPLFGGASAARHSAAGLVPLDVPLTSSLRRDVDTPADVAAVASGALGPRTAELLGRVTDAAL